MDEFRSEAIKSMREICQLELALSNSSDSTEIYSNKYKIRKILSAIAEEAKRFVSTGDIYAQLLWGFFTAKLANNFIETEEPRAEARIRLLEIANYFEARNDLTRKDLLNNFAGLLQYTYNSLAVAADIEDGVLNQPVLQWLNKAQTVYQEYRKIVGEAVGPECWETLSNFASTSKGDSLTRSAILESGYTTTLFLLAQIYSNLNERQKSAEFCRATLSRQLELAPTVDTLIHSFDVAKQMPMGAKIIESGGSIPVESSDWLVQSLQLFDPLEWAINASTLSTFYSDIGDYISALECLLTARTILKGGLESSSGTKPWADISRLTAEYSLGLLEQGRKNVLDYKLQTISNKILNPVNYGELFNQDTKSALQEAYGESIDNPDVNNAVLVLTSPPKAYLEAAKIFRWTCRCISEALLYYKLNEHCSDAIELIRAHANAYGYLAIFEPDLSRKCRMQKRRVNLLEDLLKELNPQHYMTSCRVIMSECSDALTALRDLNEQKLERAIETSGIKIMLELPKQAKKVNVLGRRALNMYARLLDSFLVPATRKECAFYEESWLRSALTISAGPPRNSIEHLQSAQRYYEKMVEIADKHARSGYKFDVPEVEIAREMITLLTAKIARISLDE